MINAGRKRHAAEVIPAQVSGRRQSGKLVVGDGEVGMSLCRHTVTRVECAIGDDAWWESGDGSARADSDATENLSGAAISHG